MYVFIDACAHTHTHTQACSPTHLLLLLLRWLWLGLKFGKAIGVFRLRVDIVSCNPLLAS